MRAAAWWPRRTRRRSGYSGYTAAELIGTEFSLLVPELARDQLAHALEYYRPSDEARAKGLGREVTGRRKDGSTVPIEMAVSDMMLGGQRYFTGIVRDITARKEAEMALQRAVVSNASACRLATRTAESDSVENRARSVIGWPPPRVRPRAVAPPAHHPMRATSPGMISASISGAFSAATTASAATRRSTIGWASSDPEPPSSPVSGRRTAPGRRFPRPRRAPRQWPAPRRRPPAAASGPVASNP